MTIIGKFIIFQKVFKEKGTVFTETLGHYFFTISTFWNLH